MGLGWFTLHYVPVNICVMGQQPDTVTSEDHVCVPFATEQPLEAACFHFWQPYPI